MTRYVALLRGIAPMDPNMRNVKLRGVCEELGLRNVMSVVSSGNLVFDADTADRKGLERALEAAWPERLGFESTSIVRTCEELASLQASRPFGELEHGPASYLLVTFAQGAVVPSFAVPHEPLGPGATIIATTAHELFTVTDTTAADTPSVMSWMEGEFGKAITSRTWRTVLRILARCAS